jgi:hypothetical protein
MEKEDNSLTGILKIIQINPKFYFSSGFLAGGGLDEYVLGIYVKDDNISK